jgi:ATP-dependent RNA helicase DeaD
MHGDMNQSGRDRVMADFRSGQVKILVATDVVGRGIDVTSISHIINYDIPSFCDDYVHRVGRTGRMGREGIAFTFVAPDEGPELTRIEERINRLLKRDEMKDFEFRARESIERATG